MTKPGEAQRYFREIVLPHTGADCVIWPYATQDGYGVVYFDGRTQIASRLLCQIVNGDPPSKRHEAAHSCGDRRCVNPGHISWKTHAENEEDKKRHGTVWHGSTGQFGERNGRAKLTLEKAIEIRALKGRFTQKEIGAQFGVDSSVVGRIHRNKYWMSP